MIIINIIGGLGNQLFQLFSGISYVIDKNQYTNFKICDKFYNKQNKCTKRNTYWNSFLQELNTHILPPKYNIDIQPNIKFNDTVFNQNTFNKLNEIDPSTINKNIIFSGYFQSYIYFQHNFDKICEILNIETKRNHIQQKYQYDYNNICSIHFRYGDYKKFSTIHFNLPEEYFINATNIIKSKKYLLFFEKEDTELIKTIVDKIKNNVRYQNIDEIEFIFIDTDIPDYEQLLIMSLCQNNIIANSSFSWFAAYFNNNPNKIVIRPSKWYCGKTEKQINIIDMSPNDWKVIHL